MAIRIWAIGAAVAAGLLGAMGSPAQAVGYISAGALLKRCQSSKPEDQTICVTYVLGVVDTHFSFQTARPDLPRLFCLPAGTSADKLSAEVMAYLQAHPEELRFAAADEVALALAKAFPCQAR